MSGTSKERLGTGRPKLGTFDATGEKDVAKREKIKAYNALLLKLGAVEDAPKNFAATPIRRSKDTARSKDGSSGKKTEVKVLLATNVTPGKNSSQQPKLSTASTQEDLAKAAPPPQDKSPLRFNNVKLIETKKPAPTPVAVSQQKKVILRESMTRIPLKNPAPKKPSPQKPATKASVKPPVPTVAQLRSQTPTPAASTRKPALPKTPTRLQQPAGTPATTATLVSASTSATAYRTPVKSSRDLKRDQQAVKAASLTLRLASVFSKSRFTQQSFALNKLKVVAQHFEIKEAFAEEFRGYSLKKRLFYLVLGALRETKKR